MIRNAGCNGGGIFLFGRAPVREFSRCLDRHGVAVSNLFSSLRAHGLTPEQIAAYLACSTRPGGLADHP